MMKSNTDASIADEMDQYLQTLTDMDRFSGAVLVARQGNVVLSQGYGLANREHEIPNHAQTKFRVASITKQFTAMAILILQSHGKLHVHDPIAQYLPQAPVSWKSITIHHLLNHTAGIPNYTDTVDWRTVARTPMTVSEIIELFQHKPLEFAPGSQHQYSNSGYIVLGYIIEQVTGKQYEEYLVETIFKPQSMNYTGYDHTEVTLKHRASGYDLRGDTFVNATYLDMDFPYAAGALYSTVEDLYIWDQALYTEQLVSQAYLQTMFMITPFLANYGYGIETSRKFDRRMVGHGGAIHGFRSTFERYPEDKVCIIVLSNITNVKMDEVAQNLGAIIFDAERTPLQRRTALVDAPQRYAACAGKYQLAPEIILTVTPTNEGLLLEASGGGKALFLPESELGFFRKTSDSQVVFHRDEQEQVAHLTLIQDGVEVQAWRVE